MAKKMAIVSQKITDFPKQPERHPPDDSHVKALTHERDVLLQQQNQYGPVIAELKHKLKAADAERLEAIRQRDLALKEKQEAVETVAAAKKNSAEVRKGFGSAKNGEAETDHQISALRQARDGMATQVSEFKSKIGELEDQAAEMSYNREAIEKELQASRAQVRELQAAMETAAASSAEAARAAELEAELKDLRDKFVAAEKQIEAVSRERDSGAQQLSENTIALDVQFQGQFAEIARLKKDLGETSSRLSENEQLTKQFDKRRLDMIELAAQLENAQREIRNLSASLAEARLHAKLVGKKSGADKRGGAIQAKTGAIYPAETAGKEDILALKKTFQKFTRDQTQLGLLQEMESRALCFAAGAREGGCAVFSRVAVAFAAFLRDLHEVPDQISQPAFRTVNQTIELLALLIAEPSIELTVNLSDARIYVVDDDAATCATVVEAMDVVGLQTNFALYSKEAIAQIEESRQDLIILDVHLPEMDGFDLCSNIRGMALHAQTPVFFITGNTSLENRAKSSLRGGNEFIPKPFSIPELGLKALRSVITSQLENR